MKVLTPTQIQQFNEQGFTLLESVLDCAVLENLTTQFDGWVEESRSHTELYGETLDGRARFDLEPGHSATLPALRRVASPVEISDAYLEVMRSSPAVDAISQLLGPNIKFNNSKINSKLPGAATQVKLHQDFPFAPHTNDSLVTALYFLDDVSEDNGPLEVVPGTHRGPIYEHWHDGVFTGAVSNAVAAKMQPRAVTCTGPAGSVCLMHIRLLHGSGPNLSASPRTLFIAAYCAGDAHPLAPNHLPSKYVGEIVRGEASNHVRCTEFEMALPETPTAASFFAQQAKQNVDAGATQVRRSQRSNRGDTDDHSRES